MQAPQTDLLQYIAIQMKMQKNTLQPTGFLYKIGFTNLLFLGWGEVFVFFENLVVLV